MIFVTQLKVVVYKLLARLLNCLRVDLVHFTKPWRVEIFDTIRQLKSERHFLMSYMDAYNLASLATSTWTIDGEVAEIGSYEGVSAKLIGKYKDPDKRFYVIDSFEGLPEVSDVDREGGFSEGAFKSRSSVEDVRRYLAHVPNVTVLQGFFPERNAAALENLRFSLVHLDIDLQQPTLDCLDFFYPRMAPGGVIISHDFHTPGIRGAFKTFLEDKPEIAIELMEHQGVIVKL